MVKQAFLGFGGPTKADIELQTELESLKNELRDLSPTFHPSEYMLPVTEEGLTAIGDDPDKLMDWINYGSPNATPMMDDAIGEFYRRMDKELGEERAYELWRRRQDILDDVVTPGSSNYIEPEDLMQYINQYEQALHEGAVNSKNRGYS
tara:strand:- start:47 stop:493 length:447 start_codon:yes stop_codon:yes gene_type:complete